MLAQLAAAVAITVVTIASVFVAHARVIVVAWIGAAARRTAAQLSVDATGHRLGTVLLFHAEVAVRGAVDEQTGQTAIGRRSTTTSQFGAMARSIDQTAIGTDVA